MPSVDLIEPFAVWLTFAGSTMTLLGGITVALINTRRKVDKTEAMTIEIRHMVNSRATAQDDRAIAQDARIDQLAAQLVAAGLVPDAAPSADIALAGGTMTVTGSAVTMTGETVSVTGEAVIAPTPEDPSSDLP